MFLRPSYTGIVPRLRFRSRPGAAFGSLMMRSTSRPQPAPITRRRTLSVVEGRARYDARSPKSHHPDRGSVLCSLLELRRTRRYLRRRERRAQPSLTTRRISQREWARCLTLYALYTRPMKRFTYTWSGWSRRRRRVPRADEKSSRHRKNPRTAPAVTGPSRSPRGAVADLPPVVRRSELMPLPSPWL